MKYNSNFFTSNVGLLIVFVAGIYFFYEYRKSIKDEGLISTRLKTLYSSIGCFLYFFW